MNRKSFLVGLLAAGCFVATSTLMTSPGNAQADPKVAKAMAILKAETAKLGAPKAEGTDQTADKTTPGLYFGSTKVNNDFTIVDKVKAEAGGTATLFVKSGDDYVRVSTNVPGSVQGRALGTILDPKGKAIVNINKGEAFYGEVDILGKLEYWRAALHERGLHTEAMVMGCAASTIKILRGRVSEKTPKRRA